jgi:hypothetical protein
MKYKRELGNDRTILDSYSEQSEMRIEDEKNYENEAK